MNHIDNGFIIYGPQDLVEGTSLYAFDLDHTLIKPKNNRVHPKDSTDWMWLDAKVIDRLRAIKQRGDPMVIFTNQAGVEKRPGLINEIIMKLDQIFAELGFAILTCISTGYTKWRKPSPSMFQHVCSDYFPEVVPGLSWFIGDAAGRPGDFSADDRKFAVNTGMKFRLELDWIHDRDDSPLPNIVNTAQLLAQYTAPVNIDTRIRLMNRAVIIIGRPASGKSSLCKHYMPDHGVVNQDTVNGGRPGTRKQCLKLWEFYLRSGYIYPVLDNTSPDEASRKEYVDIARTLNIEVVYLHVDIPEALSKHLNQLRSYTDGRRVPDIAYAVYNKKFNLSHDGVELVTINRLVTDESIPEDILSLQF